MGFDMPADPDTGQSSPLGPSRTPVLDRRMGLFGLGCAAALFAFAAWFAVSGWDQYQRLTAVPPPGEPVALHRIESGVVKTLGPAGLVAGWWLVAGAFAAGGIFSLWEAVRLLRGIPDRPNASAADKPSRWFVAA